MGLPPAAEQSLVERFRQNGAIVWSILNEAKALRREWDAGGFSAALTDSDVQVIAPGLTAADITNLVVSLEAFSDLLDTGHGTNLAIAKS